MQHSQKKEEASLSETEAYFMQTTFDEIDVFINVPDNKPADKLPGSRLIVSQKLRDALEHDLLQMSEQLLNNVSPDVSLKN